MALYKYHYITLDTKRTPRISLQNIVAGETGNMLVITLTNNESTVNLAEKSNGEFIYRICLRVDSNLGVRRQDSAMENSGITLVESGANAGKAEILLSKDSFTSGMNRAWLEIFSTGTETNDTLICSALFTFRATENSTGENAGSVYPSLIQAEEEAREATTAANTAATAANNAASSATSAASSANTAASNANTAASAANTAAAAANAAAALYPGIYMLPYESSEWIDGTDGAAYDYQTELTITDEEYRALLEDKPDVVLGVRVTLPSGKEVTLIEYNRHGAPYTTDVDFKADAVVDGYFVTATLEENWNVRLIIRLWTAEHYVAYNDLIEEMVSASRNLNNLPVGRYTSEQAPAHAPTVVTGADANKYFGLSGYIEVSPSTKYTARFYNITPRNARHCVSYYNASKQYIGNFSNLDIGARSNQVTFTTPATAKYVHIYKYDADGITISADSHLLLEKFISSTDYGYVGPQTLIDDTARVAASEAQKGVSSLGTRVSTLEGNEPLILHVASVTPSQTSDETGSLTFASGETDEIYANALTRDMEFDFVAPWENTLQNTIRMKKSQVLIDANAMRVVTFVGYNVYHTNGHGMRFYPVAINVYYLADGTYYGTIYERLPDYTSTIPVAASVSGNRVSFKNSDGTTLFYFDLPVGD